VLNAYNPKFDYSEDCKPPTYCGIAKVMKGPDEKVPDEEEDKEATHIHVYYMLYDSPFLSLSLEDGMGYFYELVHADNTVSEVEAPTGSTHTLHPRLLLSRSFSQSTWGQYVQPKSAVSTSKAFGFLRRKKHGLRDSRRETAPF